MKKSFFVEKKITVGPLECHCRILICLKTGETCLIDPGAEPLKILQLLQSLSQQYAISLKIKYILHTHAHFDHIGGSRGVVEFLPSYLPQETHSAFLGLHPGDHFLYQNLILQGTLFQFSFEDPLPIQIFLEHEQDIHCGCFHLSVIHTPGHSPGSICFRLHEDKESRISETVYSGDTLFFKSIGRSDLWGGNQEQLVNSIREKIFNLDQDTRVCPGHGPDTTIYQEKKFNPFMQ